MRPISKCTTSPSRTPRVFGGKVAQRVDWFQPFTKVKEGDFNGDVRIKWFVDGKLNISHNCLDRHLAERGDQVAIIWEGDSPDASRKLTYKELHEQVCKFANVLKSLGLKKGDEPPSICR